MGFFLSIFQEAWGLFLESSVYVLFGLVVSGVVRGFMNPQVVARHLGQGRFLSVIKAALIGIPIPLCSCGVLPAAASLKKQGANNGAVTAFLISTPESGVDSIAVSYALLDPIMTVVRPVVAFVTAVAAGITENLFHRRNPDEVRPPDLSCPVDACCNGEECPPEKHMRHHGGIEKVRLGLRYAFTEIWDDMAGWFFLGLLLAGIITSLVPEDFFSEHLGSGPVSMVIILAVSIPLYICATASTPIAAALILKGVSPGAALVFLLAGPATNVTSLTVLFGLLGKRATAIYLVTLSVLSVGFGLALDGLYPLLGISPRAVVGQAGEWMPLWVQWGAGLFLLGLSARPLFARLKALARKQNKKDTGQAPRNSSRPLPRIKSCKTHG